MFSKVDSECDTKTSLIYISRYMYDWKSSWIHVRTSTIHVNERK